MHNICKSKAVFDTETVGCALFLNKTVNTWIAVICHLAIFCATYLFNSGVIISQRIACKCACNLFPVTCWCPIGVCAERVNVISDIRVIFAVIVRENTWWWEHIIKKTVKICWVIKLSTFPNVNTDSAVKLFTFFNGRNHCVIIEISCRSILPMRTLLSGVTVCIGCPSPFRLVNRRNLCYIITLVNEMLRTLNNELGKCVIIAWIKVRISAVWAICLAVFRKPNRSGVREKCNL